MPYDVTSPVGQVRLLINDTRDDQVFEDAEVGAFLHMEGGSVKRAAALAYETIAGDEALTSKYIRTQDLQTDGPKVATSLLQIAERWRKQADTADDADDAGFFEVVDFDGCHGPELTNHSHGGWW